MGIISKCILQTLLTRESSGWSDQNLNCHFAHLQSKIINDCTQNFSCWHTVHRYKKNYSNLEYTVQIVRCLHMTAKCLTVAPYTWVNSIAACGPGTDKAVKDLRNVIHIHANIQDSFYIRNHTEITTECAQKKNVQCNCHRRVKKQ